MFISTIYSQGHLWAGRTDYPQGDPENPVTKEQLQKKFRALAALNFDSETVETIIYSINELENVKNLLTILANRREVSRW